MPSVPIREYRLDGRDALLDSLGGEAHPLAAARVAAGLPPRTRTERLVALAELAESRPTLAEYERRKAEILEGAA